MTPTYEQLNVKLGNPTNEFGGFDQGWKDENLTYVEVPFLMKTSWNPYKTITRLEVHKVVAPMFKDGLRGMVLHRGEGYLINRGYNYCGGAYHFRKTTGGKYLSTHSWGISVDLNPHLAPYREKHKTRTPQGWLDAWRNNQPEFINVIWLDLGFWSFEFDGMHYQWCTGRSNMALGRV